MTLTPTQLDRLRAGARLVAVPFTCEPTDDEGSDCTGDVSTAWEGQPIDPSLPGLVWGKARAVRRSDLTLDDYHGIFGMGVDLNLRPMVGEAEWLWLVPVKGITPEQEKAINAEIDEIVSRNNLDADY